MTITATSAVLHSNGETLAVTGAQHVKNLLSAFPAWETSHLGTEIADSKHIIVSREGSAFIELTMGDNGFNLAEKPQCNNAFDCPTPEPAPAPDPAPEQQTA